MPGDAQMMLVRPTPVLFFKEPAKRKQTRNGKVVGLLRKKFPTSSEEEDVRCDQCLVVEELAIALKHHLLYLARGSLPSPSSPPILDLALFHDKIVRKGTRVRELHPRQEVLMYCLFALGSRRSEHSGITGGGIGSTDRWKVYEAGLRKEDTCRKLAQAAVDLAISCKLLEDPSSEAVEVVSVLRIALFGVSPRHPFTAHLAAQLHRSEAAHYKGETAPRLPSEARRLFLTCEYDCYTALLQKTQPTISDAELSLIYGWTPALIPDALRFMQINNPSCDFRAPGRIVTVGVLRDLVRLQRREPLTLGDLPAACRTIHRIMTSLDIVEVAMRKFRSLPNIKFGVLDELASTKGFNEMVSSELPPFGHTVPKVSLAPHLSGIPMMAETIMSETVERLLGHMAATEPKVQQLISMLQDRFVAWLKMWIFFMSKDPDFYAPPDSASRHTLSLLLLMLDLHPKWIEICVDAAVKQSVSKDASLLSWQDLKQLRHLLAEASSIFLRNAKQFHNLSEALRAHQIQLSDPSSPDHLTTLLSSDSSPSGSTTSLEDSEAEELSSAIATKMVNKVLVELIG